jgi:hypothetical protein
MILPCSIVNEDFVEENKDKASEERLENIIHESLESGGGVGEAKGHHKELIMSLVSPKGHFSNILRAYPNLVIA